MSVSSTGDRSLGDLFGKSWTFDELEHQRLGCPGFFDAVNLANVGMVERGQDFRFSLKAAHALGIGGELLGQDFQRDISVQLGIGGAVDLAHAAFTDFLQDFVMADACPEHVSPSQTLPKWCLDDKRSGICRQIEGVAQTCLPKFGDPSV